MSGISSRNLARPGWELAAGICHHPLALSYPTLTSSDPEPWDVLTVSLQHTLQGRTRKKISLKGRRILGRALTYPGPLLHSGLLGYSQVLLQAHPDPSAASLAAVQHAPQASWNQGMGPHCHRDTVFTRATSEESLVRSLKLLISSSPHDFLSKALLAL